jgi:RND family efflux transporter MFP subunit
MPMSATTHAEAVQSSSIPSLTEAPVRAVPGPRKPTGRRKRGPLAWVLALGVLTLAVVAAVAVVRWRFFPDNPTGGEVLGTVTRANLPITVTERGELESTKTITVNCEVEGQQNKITWIVPEGTHVTKGEKVVTFDTDQLARTKADQEVKVKQAEGKAKAAQGELEVAKNKAEDEIEKAKLALRLAELDRDSYLDEQGEYIAEVEDKRGALALAKKDLVESREKLEHFRKMVKKGLFPAENLRLKEADLAEKQFKVNRDEAKLVVLEKFTRQRKEAELTAKADDAKRALDRAKSSGDASIAKAQSELEAAEITSRLEKATLERIEKQLAGCTVAAPADGILVYSKVRWWDDNSRIQPGAMVFFRQPIFSLPDLTQMQMKVKVHEAMVNKVKPGQKAEIRIDACGGRVLHGAVRSVATLANAENWGDRFVKEYETIVSIDDLPLEAGLKPGYTGEVKIRVNELPDVVLVPVQAVGQLEGKHYCFVAGARTVERREIEVGENNDKFVQIQSGVREGEKVALDARARLAAEAKTAEVQPEAPPPPPQPPPGGPGGAPPG